MNETHVYPGFLVSGKGLALFGRVRDLDFHIARRLRGGRDSYQIPLCAERFSGRLRSSAGRCHLIQDDLMAGRSWLSTSVALALEEGVI